MLLYWHVSDVPYLDYLELLDPVSLIYTQDWLIDIDSMNSEQA